MSFSDITLSAGMRANLLNLQNTAALMNRTQLRLSTAKKVNSAIDDAAAFFAAQAEMSRAGDLAALKDNMGEALQTLKAADQGLSAITKLIEQGKGLIASARSATTADRATLAQQFDDLMAQIDQLATDASYKGTNLLDSGTLTVNFNADATSSLTLTGFDASSGGLGVTSAVTANAAWVADTNLDASLSEMTAALGTLRTNAAGLSSNSGTIQIRVDFTMSLVNTLTQGATNLTAADLNEEGANMQALQIQQQLGISALALSAQSQSAILKLFG